MKKFHITCSLGHRLFDIIEGSDIKVKIKCTNQRICPHKDVCVRDNEIYFGEIENPFNIQYVHYICPICNKRLFDATANSEGIIQIKCDNCGKPVNIAVGM